MADAEAFAQQAPLRDDILQPPIHRVVKSRKRAGRYAGASAYRSLVRRVKVLRVPVSLMRGTEERDEARRAVAPVNKDVVLSAGGCGSEGAGGLGAGAAGPEHAAPEDRGEWGLCLDPVDDGRFPDGYRTRSSASTAPRRSPSPE
jgi:hypothetical protein